MTKEKINKLLKDVQVLAVICNQWGDTGKGKFSDYFASEWADIIARGTGGNNAGHTVVIGDKERIFHLIPAGIVYDKKGKISVLGEGMVIDIKVLLEELKELKEEGYSYSNLKISKYAHVIMPYHIEQDKAKNLSQKKGGIGSTGRGIGPCYADKIRRKGIMIKDLFDRETLKKKISDIRSYYPNLKIEEEPILEEFGQYAEKIKGYVCDTGQLIRQAQEEGKKILIEGAQGLLLSIDHGTYPYVTSSDCSLNGTANGVGLGANKVDMVLGIIKYPFMTRVGGGPFPTELGGQRSAEYCSNDEYKKEYELKKYGVPHKIVGEKAKYDPSDKKIIEMINSSDEFVQGVGIRLAAGEYGATTRRPRRTGWTDAVTARYATKINGPLFILTKADALAGADKFRICFGYKKGQETLTEFERDINILDKVSPYYKEYEGYDDISKIRDYEELPASLKESIKDFEDFTGGKVVIVSVGPERDETIVRDLS